MRRVLWLVGAWMATMTLALATPVHAADRTVKPVAAEQAKKKKHHRRGGKVRAAWPRSKKAKPPKNQLARWLAKQVGPAPRKKKHARRARVAQSSAALSTSGSGKLWLVRSFDIPTTDSADNRLANYSWTYDNALATFAFIGLGLRSGAEQLLDQLQALQRTDGSIEFAFDTRTGDAAPYYRSGALAWVGLAAAAYRREY